MLKHDKIYHQIVYELLLRALSNYLNIDTVTKLSNKKITYNIYSLSRHPRLNKQK